MRSQASPAKRVGAATGYQAIVAAEGFALGVRCDADELFAIEYLPQQAELRPSLPLAAEAVRQLRAYLVDPRHVFCLPLRTSGTPFQQRVWQSIAAIPCGETRTYGAIARKVRSAPRAVGGACGANPFPVVVPCHRVVAAAGGFNSGLGGFANTTTGSMIDIKRWLLAHEQRG